MVFGDSTRSAGFKEVLREVLVPRLLTQPGGFNSDPEVGHVSAPAEGSMRWKRVRRDESDAGDGLGEGIRSGLVRQEL